MSDPIASLRDKFNVTERGHNWRISCPHCGAAWILSKPQPDQDVAIGSILKLLDHAASHGKKGGR